MGKTKAGTPVQVQLLGGDPDKLARSAVIAVKMGATAIDLNFGCPSPTVNHHDGGATLLKYPTRIREIIKTVRSVLPESIPVSAKLRLGWDNPRSIFLNTQMAVEGGAAWITIHGRTRLQGYIPPAFWEPIGEVQKNFEIPVVANGEIWTLDDFKRCREITGCEHFMLGRGALANPRLPLLIAHELGLGPPPPDLEELPWNHLLFRFVQLAEGFSDRPGYIPSRLKHWTRLIDQKSPLPWYNSIKPLKQTEEILDCIRSFYL
jgi:tRNA-dihydrouridine synthase C